MVYGLVVLLTAVIGMTTADIVFVREAGPVNNVQFLFLKNGKTYQKSFPLPESFFCNQKTTG